MLRRNGIAIRLQQSERFEAALWGVMIDSQPTDSICKSIEEKEEVKLSLSIYSVTKRTDERGVNDTN